MDDKFLVFYQDENSSYANAKKLLERYSFKVQEEKDKLVAKANGFTFDVVIKKGPAIDAKAKEIGKNSSHESAMNLCNACFVVGVNDLEEALDEINTLMEIQGALQDASKGYLFLPWNDSLSAPYLD
jgi:hypothetical protein